MTDKNFEKLSALKNEHLSRGERELLRGKIVSFMNAHPVRMEPSPYVTSFRKMRKPIAVSSVLALFALSAGVSYASEAAVPGDLLYPIKVHVNEAVLATVSRTPTAKASFAQKQIERRAVETETLIKHDKLATSTKETLTRETKKSLKSFSDAKGELLRDGKVNEVARQESDIKATFDRHISALATLGVASTSLRGGRDRDKDDEKERNEDNKREERLTSASSTDQKFPRSGRTVRDRVSASSSLKEESEGNSSSDVSSSDSKEVEKIEKRTTSTQERIEQERQKRAEDRQDDEEKDD